MTDKKKTSANKKKTSTIENIVPDLVTRLEAGVNFGHEKSKRDPRMGKYVFMQRNRVAIVDLNLTRDDLIKAAEFAHETATTPSNEILFVGTKRQARSIIQKYAEATGQPYVTKRWLGGTLTNFSTILKSIEKLEELKRTEDSEQVAKLTKKEKSVRRKEIERLEAVLEGIKNLKTLPTAIFVAGSHDEKIAVREAKRVGIPVIGITDTNADPSSVDYPIPGNDDAIRSLDLITKTIAGAIAQAKGIKMEMPKKQKSDTKKKKKDS